MNGELKPPEPGVVDEKVEDRAIRHVIELEPLKVIQEILRHSNIRTTSDRYTHLVPQVVAEALAAMDRTLPGAT